MVSLRESPLWPGPWGGYWSINTPQNCFFLGSGCHPFVPLINQSLGVVSPPNFLGEGTLHLALGNFPSSGGIYEPSAANTQSSWGSFTSPANGWGWGVAGTTGASSKVQNTESHREMPLVALPTQAAHSHTDTHRTQRVSGGGDFKKHTSAFQNQNVISLHSEKLRGNGSTFIK